ncbi:hypothetical protein IFM89_023570 [Coptis chinensis]|uniref:AMP-activated protein kinase glycogen-binding domain-containing protein n=1 Tax=Coptis chinensis TaxID=261450 RepID=A0A835IFI1_9MAGN|nr:hypothetical protein IFM89_023570 [Coptis chinensis]
MPYPFSITSGSTTHTIVLTRHMITWTFGGNTVAVQGSWDNWTSRRILQRSGKDHSILLVLPSSIYQYWFVVDGERRYIPDLPCIADDTCLGDNLLDVHTMRRTCINVEAYKKEEINAQKIRLQCDYICFSNLIATSDKRTSMKIYFDGAYDRITKRGAAATNVASASGGAWRQQEPYEAVAERRNSRKDKWEVHNLGQWALNYASFGPHPGCVTPSFY